MRRKPIYKSTRFWFCIWAAVVVTAGLQLKWEASVLTILAAAIVTYVGGESLTNYKHGPEMTDEHKE